MVILLLDTDQGGGQITLMITVPRTIDLSLILRGIMASAVVVWHTVGYQQTLPDIINIPGRVAVWFFFGISGYVIAHGFFHGRYEYSRAGLVDYTFRRLRRILPLFYLLTALAVLILLLRGSGLPFGLERYPAEFMAIQWVHNYALNGVFWTLGIELQFYLVAPVICWLLLSSSRLTLALSVVALLLLWVWPHLANQWFSTSYDNRTTMGVLQFFVVGILLAKLTTDETVMQRLSARGSIISLAALGAATLCLTSWLYHNDLQSFWRLDGALLTMISIASFLAVHIGIERRRIEPGLASRALMTLGVLAYGLYAWHGLVLMYFPFFQGQFLATYAVSVVLAIVSYVAIEKPALMSGRRFTRF